MPNNSLMMMLAADGPAGHHHSHHHHEHHRRRHVGGSKQNKGETVDSLLVLAGLWSLSWFLVVIEGLLQYHHNDLQGGRGPLCP